MTPSPVDRLLTPRVALLANAGLVCAGSLFALLGWFDATTGALLVLIGFVGVAVTWYGQRGG